MPEFHAEFGSAELEFRILRLCSRTFSIKAALEGQLLSGSDVPVHCQLYHKFHEDKPYYEALSYTWGDPQDTVPVFVNDLEHGVTRNLYAALQHLRHETEDVHIWIDALCINQHDDAEKSEQVKKMKDIYVDAAKTIVWLGPSDDSTDNKMIELDRIGKFVFENGILDLLIKFGMLSSDDQDGYQSTDKEIHEKLSTFLNEALNNLSNTQQLIAGFASLLSRPYWERVWILQEIIVSPNAIIQVGKSTMPFPHLHAVHMYISYMSAHVCRIVHARLMVMLQVSTETEEFTSLSQLFMSICNTTIPKPASRIAGMRRNHQLFVQEDPTATEPPGLMKLLAKVFIDNTPKATHAKDRIYALLGMAFDFETLNMEPDYSDKTSCTDVYAQVAKAIISRGDIEFLSFAQYTGGKAKEGPSWVPDWERTIFRPSGQLPWDSSFRAYGSKAFCPSPENISLLPNQVRLSGFVIDRVQNLAPTPWTPGEKGVTKAHVEVTIYLSEIASLCDLSDAKLSSSSPRQDPYPNPDDRKTAYYRLPVADQEEYGIGFIRRATSDLYPSYQAVVEELRQRGHVVQTPEGSEAEFKKGTLVHSGRYYNVLGWQRNRHAFMSEKGFMGLGPVGIREGDLIVVFRGGKFVYVLRSVDDHGKEGGEPCFELVGEAYVHGIMYGELFREGEQTNGEIEEREFVLI
ncbi:uncharacterized protein PAC_02692 [Phialocephala subalpina]|uniref:Heterokaryon incompatibility domain-containing protein n=1 Tax=Phialocephala subalpina TaxID=576137 RepID=A0A1L7WJ58_9HELO|nr:uncharacterized protein PAC_02692 [Phialocephala subalpina]